MFNAMVLSFPSPPTLGSGESITTFILQFLLWIIEIPVYGLVIVLETIFLAISGALGSSIGGLFSILTGSFSETVSALSGFGIFASVIAAFIWGASLIIILLFANLAFHMFITDAEEE